MVDEVNKGEIEIGGRPRREGDEESGPRRGGGGGAASGDGGADDGGGAFKQTGLAALSTKLVKVDIFINFAQVFSQFKGFEVPWPPMWLSLWNPFRWIQIGFSFDILGWLDGLDIDFQTQAATEIAVILVTLAVGPCLWFISQRLWSDAIAWERDHGSFEGAARALRRSFFSLWRKPSSSSRSSSARTSR